MTTSPTPQLNDEDLDLLSAYLDKQVDDAERVALEARLERDPALQRALDELRITAALLRDLPPARLPRSFTIDPASVQRRSGWLTAAPWLRLGSAVAAVLLAFSVTFEFVAGNRAGAPAAPLTAMQDEAPAEGAAETFDSAAPASGDTAGAAEAAPEAQIQIAPAPTSAAALAAPPPLMPEATPADSFGAASAAQDQGANSAASDAAPAASDAAPAASDALPEGPITQGDPALGQSGSSSPDTSELEAQQAARLNEAEPALPPQRLVQAALAALAVLLALASVWVARRQRGT